MSHTDDRSARLIGCYLIENLCNGRMLYYNPQQTLRPFFSLVIDGYRDAPRSGPNRYRPSRTNTVGSTWSIYISKTDQSGPSQYLGPISPVQVRVPIGPTGRSYRWDRSFCSMIGAVRLTNQGYFDMLQRSSVPAATSCHRSSIPNFSWRSGYTQGES
jgi:hypothetical protein